jgi:arylsulfatase A-like enzyme
MGDGRPTDSFDDDVWELYDTSKDWSQAHDLAAEMPVKLEELQRLFLIEAVKYCARLRVDDDRVALRAPGGRQGARG